MPLRTSPAAEFQSYQTRAKMAGALWSRAIKVVLYIWISFTMWLVWYRVGLYRPWLHHALFGRWILCGILNDTPVIRQLTAEVAVPARGGWYPLPAVAAWLDGPQMYGDSFY